MSGHRVWAAAALLVTARDARVRDRHRPVANSEGLECGRVRGPGCRRGRVRPDATWRGAAHRAGGRRLVDGHLDRARVCRARSSRCRGHRRQAKIRTPLDTIPHALGPGAAPPSLFWNGRAGKESAAAVPVSNNPYRLGRTIGSGARAPPGPAAPLPHPPRWPAGADRRRTPWRLPVGARA